ncbi:MAG TPA: cytochrome d ubiquinol oxidase subunit II [Candidatus Baltobacteraceae bacterium]|jgi:cytochrome d ubiquinol oxidase subunit II
MSDLAFAILAFMIAVYVLLDGYDLGVGALAPFVSRNEEDRAAAMHAIGPYWNGNEVWLIAAGAVSFALFPLAYASAFSGFYLPFMIVLWLLMFRGIAMEVREHFPSELWHAFWDTAFSAASALLILLFGLTIGNLVRGLPLHASGFFMGTFAFLLNPYAIAVGLFAVAALAQHGATFLWMVAGGEIGVRSRDTIARLWWIVLALYIVITILTLAIRPVVFSRPWLAIIALISLAAFILLRIRLSSESQKTPFVCSTVFIAGLLVAAAATIYPYLLPDFAGPGGLTIYAASASPQAMVWGISATLVGLILVSTYTFFVVRRLSA